MVYYFLGWIHRQLNEDSFEVSTDWSGKDEIIKCYLSRKLFRENIRPLVGDRILIEYNSGLRRIERRRFYIIKVVY